MLTSIIKKTIGLLAIVCLLSCSSNFYFNEVVYNYENGNAAVSVKVELDERVVKPEDPVLKGFTFLGWYKDKKGETERFTFNKLITSKTVLYAVWENNIKYLASFEVGNTSTPVKDQIIPKGGLVTKPINDPTRSGYVFQGWYTDAAFTSFFDFSKPIPSDTIIYGRWDPNTRYELIGNTLVQIKNPRVIEYIPQKVNGVEITAVEGFVASSVRKYSFLGDSNSVTTRVVLSNTILSVSEKAFVDCISLRTVTFSGNETRIGPNAFSGCLGLVSLEMPNSIKTIGAQAFFGCLNLEKVKFSTDTATIGAQAFEDCKNLSSIELPEKLVQISDRAFYQCVRLKGVVFKDEIQTIGASAFSQCNNLESVIIKDNLNAIGEKAFEDCHSVTKVELPSTVARIGNEAFIRSRGLDEFIIRAETPPTLGNDAFSGSKLGVKIRVPATKVGTYKNTTGWDTYQASIFAIQ